MALPAIIREPAPVYRMPTPYDFSELRRQARRNADLSHQARHLFEDVCELAEATGECRAHDDHFAEAYGTSRRTVRRWVKELREAGYLRVTGATKSRRLIPTDPADLGHDLGHDDVLNGADLGHDLGHIGAPDLGHFVTDTKSISPPEGERRARAHEGQDDQGSDRPPHAPTLEAVKSRARIAGVPAEMAEEFFWFYEAQDWMTSGAHPRPVDRWEAKLMQWKLRQPSFQREEDRPVPPTDVPGAAPGFRVVTAEEIAEREAAKAAARKARDLAKGEEART